MSKIWSDAMHTFHEKFNAVSTLIVDHGNAQNPKVNLNGFLLFSVDVNLLFSIFHLGLDSTPQDEFLSLLGGARASPPLHQFLENSLGEAV